MARFAVLSENELSFLLQDKDTENKKKATKVALTLFRSYHEENWGLPERRRVNHDVWKIFNVV